MGTVEAQNQLLRRAIETITSSVDLDAVLRATIDLVTEATGGDVCFLHLWDPDEELLELRAASSGFEDALGKVRLHLEEGVSGWVAAHREIVLISDDKWTDPRYKYFKELKGELFTSMLSVPVVSRAGELVGVFNVHSRTRSDFSRRDVEFLRLTSSLIAGAIEHANLFSALAQKEAALEELMRKTIEAQEEERRRVATEIHDGVTQQMVSVWYRLHAIGRSLREDPDRAEKELATAKELVDEALQEARMAIYDLRPSILDDLGLGPSLRAFARRQLADGVSLEMDLDDRIDLPPHHEVALYRISQEAVNNIRKHAAAKGVRIGLSEEDSSVVLVVEDDGRGFDPSKPVGRGSDVAFGLTGMSERALLAGGELTIRSEPGIGTKLRVRIPLEPRPEGGP